MSELSNAMREKARRLEAAKGDGFDQQEVEWLRNAADAMDRLDRTRELREYAKSAAIRLAKLEQSHAADEEIAFRAGHKWGFQASQEGWNGEYPSDAVDEPRYQKAQDYAAKAWSDARKKLQE